jgi:hypothetical protein
MLVDAARSASPTYPEWWRCLLSSLRFCPSSRVRAAFGTTWMEISLHVVSGNWLTFWTAFPLILHFVLPCVWLYRASVAKGFGVKWNPEANQANKDNQGHDSQSSGQPAHQMLFLMPEAEPPPDTPCLSLKPPTSLGLPGIGRGSSSWPVIGLYPSPAPRLCSVSVRTPAL